MSKEQLLEESQSLLELVFIEDEIEQAEKMFDHISIPGIHPHYYDDEIVQSKEIIFHSSRKVYIIDIDLGIGKKKEGLNIIKMIREVDLLSPIIVYSAYAEYEEKAKEMGADSFILKHPQSYENDIDSIRKSLLSIIDGYMKLRNNCKQDFYLPPLDFSPEERLIACIISIDNNNKHVTLECIRGKRIFYCNLNLSKFTSLGNEYLKVGKSVELIQFVNSSGDTLIKVNKTDEEFTMDDMYKDENYFKKLPELDHENFFKSKAFGHEDTL